jgi:dUTP pyrophosphatase
MTKVKFYRLSNEARIPTRARTNDACYDVYSIQDDTINPGEVKLFSLGFKVEIPEGWEIQIRPRSGLALKSMLTVLNTPGTIDSGYRGEVGVVLYNAGTMFIWVPAGTKIAQLALKPVYDIEFEEVISEDFLEESERGKDGFGSTDDD